MLLQELRNAILADGVIDANEVSILEDELYSNGVIDQSRAGVLFEINNAVTGNANSPEWGDFFIRAVTDFVLQNESSPGIVGDEDAVSLIGKIFNEDHVEVNDMERELLDNIQEQATSVSSILTEKITEIRR